MPGATLNWRLPYMLGTEGLYTIANVTKLLAERLDTIITSGELNGAPGEPGAPGQPGPPGDPGPVGPPGDKKPTASVTCGKTTIAGYTVHKPTWAVERDLNSPSGTQASTTGLTVRQAGVYLLTAQIPWEGAGGGEYVMVKVYADGTQIAESTKVALNWETVSVVSTLVPLTAGQVITLDVIHSGSGNVTVGGPIQGGVKSRLAMTLMAA